MRRLLRWFAYCMLALGLVLAGAYLLRGVLVAPRLKSALQEALEQGLGLGVELGAVEGTYVTGLAVRDLVTRRPNPAGPVASLGAERLEVSYNPLALLGGVDGFLATARIRVRGVRVALVVPDTPAAPEPPAPEPASGRASLFLPARLPGLDVRGVDLELRGPDYRAEVRGLSLVTAEGGPPSPSEIRMAAERVHLEHPRLRTEPGDLAASLLYEPISAVIRDLRFGGARVVEELQVGLEDLERGALTWEARLEVFGGRLASRGACEPGLIEATAEARELRLEAAFGRIAGAPAVSGALDLNARVRLDPARPEQITADLDLALREAQVQGVALEGATVRASAGDGLVRVERAELRAGPNRAELRDAEFALANLLEGRPEAAAAQARGRLSLKLEDVPALLKLAGIEPDRLPAPVPPHRLTAEASVAAGEVTVDAASFEAPAGRVGAEKLRIGLPLEGRTLEEAALEGAVTLDLEDLAALGDLLGLPPLAGSLAGGGHVSGTLARPGGRLALRGKGLAYAGVPLGELQLDARADPERVDLDRLLLRRGPDRVDARGAVVLDPLRLEGVVLDAAVAELARYAKFLPTPWDESRGALSASARLEGPPLQPEGTAELSLRGARLGGVEVSKARVSAAAAGRTVEIRNLEAETSEGGLALRGTLELGDEGERFEAVIQDLRLARRGVALTQSRGTTVRATYGVAAGRIAVEGLDLRRENDRITFSGAFDAAAGRLEGSSAELRVADLKPYAEALAPFVPALSGAVEVRAEAHGALPWSDGRVNAAGRDLRAGGVELDRVLLVARSDAGVLRIEEAEVSSPLGSAALSGVVTVDLAGPAFQIELQTLRLQGEGLDLSLEGTADIAASPNRVDIRRLSLRGEPGALRIAGTAAFPDEVDLTVELSGLGSGGWLPLLAGEAVSFRGADLSAHLRGTSAVPVLDAKGSVAELRLEGAPFPLVGSFDLGFADRRLSVRGFRWAGAGGTLLEVSGSLPLDAFGEDLLAPGPLELRATARVPSLDTFTALLPEGVRPGGSAHLDLSLEGTWGDPVAALSLSASELTLPDLPFPAPPGPFALEARVSALGPRLALETLEVSSPVVHLQGQGRWDDAPLLTEVLRSGRELRGRVSAGGRLTVSELGWARRGVEALRRLEGRATVDLAVEGTLPDLAATGFVQVRDGAVRAAGGAPPLEELELDARLDTKGVTVEELRARVGGAPLTLAGRLDLATPADEAAEGGPQADFRLRGENLLLVREEGLRVRADVDLSVAGPTEGLLVSGRVALTEGRYTRPVDFLGFLRGSRKPSARQGLAFFSFPDPPLRDARFDVAVTAAAPFQIRTNVATGSLRPSLRLTGTGELPVLLGEIYLDPIRVRLPAGRLDVESGVVRFLEEDPDRPLLDASAGTRMMGYDISMQVSGPYDNPVVTLSSVPPLPDEELLLLLLAGRPPASAGGDAAARQSGLAVATYLGRGLLAGLFGPGDGGDSVADRFDLLIGQGVSRTGQETIEAQFRLADGVVRKDDTLYLRGERDVYDAFNAGVRIVFRFR
ncbi:MAG: translocation/assembly module TamB domain-containing protein [Thermodesulfobacteriota bacterium]